MLFWFLILIISIALVAGVILSLMPMTRALIDTSPGEKSKTNWLAALALLAVAPVAAVAIYLKVGVPQSFDPNFHAQQMPSPVVTFDNIPADERFAMIEGMVEGLAQRLKTTPDDFEGWRMLARSFKILDRKVESAEAYRQLTARDPNAAAEDWRNYATVLFEMRAPGAVGYSKAFLEALEKMQEFNKDDPLLLFYSGFVAFDGGDASGALPYWRRLLSIVPADASIRPQLVSLIAQAESGEQQ